MLPLRATSILVRVNDPARPFRQASCETRHGTRHWAGVAVGALALPRPRRPRVHTPVIHAPCPGQRGPYPPRHRRGGRASHAALRRSEGATLIDHRCTQQCRHRACLGRDGATRDDAIRLGWSCSQRRSRNEARRGSQRPHLLHRRLDTALRRSIHPGGLSGGPVPYRLLATAHGLYTAQCHVMMIS